MDHAVALVQAYLRINGYFTVAEYPVVESLRRGGHRVATDLDILAFRFPGSGRLVPGHDSEDYEIAQPDPALRLDLDEADLLIGEVKTGEAALNRAATEPAVLRAALTRFGGCPKESAPELVDSLIQTGSGRACDGHRVRLVAFGSSMPSERGRHEVILLGHILDFLNAYIDEHWSVLRAAHFTDPAFGFLMTLRKASRR